MKYLIKNINVFDSNGEIQTNQNIYIGKGKIENLSHNEKILIRNVKLSMVLINY